MIPSHLAEEASVLVDKDGPHVNKHGCGATPSGEGRYSQSFLDTVSHHQGGSGIVCQRDLKQCKDAGENRSEEIKILEIILSLKSKYSPTI